MSWWILLRVVAPTVPLFAPLLGKAVSQSVDEMYRKADDSFGDMYRKAEDTFREYARAWTADHQGKTPAQEKAEEVVRLERARAEYAGIASYFDGLVNAFAIGVACANAKGSVSEEERRDIQEFVGGIAGENLPTSVQGRMHAHLISPLSFDQAVELAQTADARQQLLYLDVIDVALNAGEPSNQKLYFSYLWATVRDRAQAET